MNVFLCADNDWLFSKEAFMIYSSCMYKPTYEDYKAQMKHFIADQSVKIYVCEYCGENVGILVLKENDAFAEIVGIAVDEKSRCRGIGKHLINRMIYYEQPKIVKAQTDAEAIGFYRKCGFDEEATIVKYHDGYAVRYDCTLKKMLS